MSIEDLSRRQSKKLSFRGRTALAGALAAALGTYEAGAQDPLKSITIEAQKVSNLGTGLHRLTEFARAKPHEALRFYMESVGGPSQGEWQETSFHTFIDVSIPFPDTRYKIWKSILAVAKNSPEKTVQILIVHTHTRTYLNQLIAGKLTDSQKKKAEQLGLTKDTFRLTGRFGTPPGRIDIENAKESLKKVHDFSQRNGVTILQREAVANEIGIWFWRYCDDNECELDRSGVPQKPIEELQVMWAKLVNLSDISGDEIMQSQMHQYVVKAYREHGVVAWFVPKEAIDRVQDAQGNMR